jgi:peptidoglycan/xylan/chitin deacetylase (PgdA/CDA1 family)
VKEWLREAGSRGAADARAYLAASPRELASSPPGEFGTGGPGEAAARRVLHALRVPPGVVARAALPFGKAHAARLRAASERYAYWHGARGSLDSGSWRRLTQGTAILMYHAVGRRGEPATRLVVPAPMFEQQLRWLERRRRPVLSLTELVGYRRAGRLPPAGAVVITLDDGFVDSGELAAPQLRRFRFAATLFAVSDSVGAAADWDGAAELAARPLLDWPELAALERDGIEIGAHSRTHPRLPELEPTDATDEIVGSRDVLSDRLGVPVRSFCYPYGRKTRRDVEIVAGAGFDCACGIERGLNYSGSPLHDLRRIPVDGTASRFRFALGVRFGDPDLLARRFGRLRTALSARSRPCRTRPEADRL